MRKKIFSYVAGSAACAALILLSGCQQTTDQLSNITHYVEEKIAEGKGTEVKSKEQETDTEQQFPGKQRSRKSHPLKSSLWTVMHIRRFRRKYALCTTRFMMRFSMKKKMWR